MTDNEILMLFTGVALGAQLMNVLNAFWGWRDARRDAAAVRRQRRILEADRFHRSLRLYQLQNRSRV
ncbi:hypothetical protein [Streptomyces sp. T028]|uniref:hypothetical protein n=1 Tax=Streptomyces sp. T028 TaxID=3394379 RepID=UPI003A836B79